MPRNKLRIDIIVGTRPEAIKMAPVIRELRRFSEEFKVRVIATGQHREMLDQVLDYFALSADINLDIMTRNQSLSGIASRALARLDEIFESDPGDLVLVHGDTTTTLAASIAAFHRRIPVGHVEAGLRSFDLDNPFPEEANRRICDSICSMHFAPTRLARTNLIAEGISGEAIRLTGNTAIDALFAMLDSGYSATAEARQAPTTPYILITAHRRENFGVPIRNLCHAIDELTREIPEYDFIYPVHPNPNIREPVREILAGNDRVKLIDPAGYADFVRLMSGCEFILTDSGGVQEEGPSLGKPVLVARDVTERPEAIEAGTAMLVGTDKDTIKTWVLRLASDPEFKAQMANAVNPYGDGQASKRIVGAIRKRFDFEEHEPDEFAGSGSP
jgi:UDP-N-acetylglucosamine 2-epimerase (non-hydrolysing)